MAEHCGNISAGGNPAIDSTLRRDLLRLLRALLRGQPRQVHDNGATILAGDQQPMPQEVVRLALRQGLAAQRDGQLVATQATSTFLRRSMLPEADAFAEQHRIDVEQTVDVEGTRQRVRRNLAESPLSTLARLKDRSGGFFLPPEAVDAGERLLSDSPARSCSRVSRPVGSRVCLPAARETGAGRPRSRIRRSRPGSALPAP
ncbi:MAG TPA: DUF6456 domain-containing protein [Pseudorhizobium sp.]|nr:DUF6456 domain-containing protein [Pseudorhizobium sp.]